jgi:hypothetical protein
MVRGLPCYKCVMTVLLWAVGLGRVAGQTCLPTEWARDEAGHDETLYLVLDRHTSVLLVGRWSWQVAE